MGGCIVWGAGVWRTCWGEENAEAVRVRGGQEVRARGGVGGE